MPRLVLTLRGRVTVQVEGSPGDDARPLGAKALALLAYLALQREAQPRAGLAALLWSECDDAHACASRDLVSHDGRPTANRSAARRSWPRRAV